MFICFPTYQKTAKPLSYGAISQHEIQKRLQGTYFHVSDLLEQLAPQQDKEQGKDIADYLNKTGLATIQKAGISEKTTARTLKPQREKVKK